MFCLPCGGCGRDHRRTLVALLSMAGKGSSGNVLDCNPVSSASCISNC